MKKHTVGPWTIHQNGASFSVHGNEPDCFACQDISKRAKLDRLSKAAPELLEALSELVVEINQLVSESRGVAGLHLNGDVAAWEEILPGGRFEWLGSLERAESAIAKATEGES